MSRAVEEGLRADARLLLGGDVAITQSYRPVTAEQRAAFADGATQVTDWIEMRGMARADTQGARPTLVQIKAVDTTYPLAGRLGFVFCGGVVFVIGLFLRRAGRRRTLPVPSP